MVNIAFLRLPVTETSINFIKSRLDNFRWGNTRSSQLYQNWTCCPCLKLISVFLSDTFSLRLKAVIFVSASALETAVFPFWFWVFLSKENERWLKQSSEPKARCWEVSGCTQRNRLIDLTTSAHSLNTIHNVWVGGFCGNKNRVYLLSNAIIAWKCFYKSKIEKIIIERIFFTLMVAFCSKRNYVRS